MKRLWKVFAEFLTLIALLVVMVWLLVASPFLSGPRTAFVENLLSEQLGRALSIGGDVRVGLGKDLTISVTDLALPSDALPDVTLAQVALAQFDLPVASLWNGTPLIRNAKLDGAQVNLIVTQAGETSWGSDTKRDSNKKNTSQNRNALDVFADRVFEPTNIGVFYQDARNGLDLDLTFGTLKLDRGAPDQKALALTGAGDLNGQNLTLSANYADAAPFGAELVFDEVTLSLAGTVQDAGFEAELIADIQSVGQLLDILKLNRDVEGTGSASARFTTLTGAPRTDDLKVNVALDTGQSLEVFGDVGVLGDPSDVSLVTLVRLYPEENEPPATNSRRDLKLIAVDMEIASTPGQVAQRKMVIETNGFSLVTEGEGPVPVKISQLSRSADGKLVIGSVSLRIGPPSKPFLIFDGEIGDALRLHEVSAKGLLDIPAGALLAPDLATPDHPLGAFIGEFNLDGNIEELTLTNLDGRTEKTDLWTLTVHGTVQNVLKFWDLNLEIDVDVPSGATLMEAMQLKPVDTGEAKLSASVQSDDTDWNAAASVALGASGIALTLDLDDATKDPVLKGLIESDLIHLDRLEKIFSAALELRNLNASSETDAETSETVESVAAEGGALRNVTLSPIGSAVLLTGLDMDVDIDLRKIEGAKGISTLQSELTLHDNQLNAGPLKFEYGGGHFDVNSSMDLAQAPRALALSGKAGGWKLDELLSQLNFRKGASGTLHGEFKISGGVQSVQDFLGTMNGSGTISMTNGSIETQLLDLAGLGVLPWLFSRHKQKVAPIECLRAPISVTEGRISTRQTTLETDQVQIVVFGDIDLNRKDMDLFVQPRKIGDPLSRSPWPFTAKGPLAKPDIKVKDGPRKLKRKDGADQMPAQRRACVPDILQLQ